LQGEFIIHHGGLEHVEFRTHYSGKGSLTVHAIHLEKF
jgi:hypothetical protein